VPSYDTPKAVGQPRGGVAQGGRGWFRLEKPADLAPGDGLCFLTPAGLAGTNVNAVEEGRVVPNRMEGIVPGAEVFRNFDRRFSLRLERSRTRRVIAVRAEATVAPDRIAVRFTDAAGVSAEVIRSGEFPEAKDARKMEETLAAQLARSGETIFEVREVSAVCGGRFVPVSLVAEMRREGLELLRRMRIERPLERRILPEECGVPFPKERLAAEENVTNRLAEAFWRDHGVRRIERGLDLERSTLGHEVMRSAYCIRRELGECLRERPTLRGDLFLEHGTHRYRLVFDCPRCEMALVDAGERRR
ncbi:MAG: DUF3656 domain-containing protein, partial [Alistipes sp.]|nr:DUF3656 domain-containing protein [Alistipes sp.]